LDGKLARKDLESRIGYLNKAQPLVWHPSSTNIVGRQDPGSSKEKELPARLERREALI
jgi:hypothetical protein